MKYKVLNKKIHTKLHNKFSFQDVILKCNVILRCNFYVIFVCLKPYIPFHIFSFLLNNIYCSRIMDIILYI